MKDSPGLPKNLSGKTLLTFAHRGEARFFLEKKRFREVNFPVNHFYDSANEFLLITGEGITSATARVSAVCDKFRQQIAEVINLGIAGSLHDEISPGEICSIGTVFREPEVGKAFEVYRSAESRPTADCITAGERVLDEEYARRLAGLAPLTDRELWAVAAVCALFQIPFRSYKLVSDRAGEHTDTREIKRRAGEYSARLYQFYCKL